MRSSELRQYLTSQPHDLTSYLKTLVVSLTSVWIYDLLLGRPALSQLSVPGGSLKILMVIQLIFALLEVANW